jgi:predicted CDP-diglyceride synthetase/phosphatidate cytidylyltransferase
MGAYITGSMIGRHKMIPHVSPGKTWEGFGGAIVFALLAGCGLYALGHDDVAGFATGLHVLGGWPQVIVLSGVCRPEDVDTSNQVQSQRVADAIIKKTTTGQLRDTTEKGIVARIIDTIFAF